MRWIHRLTGRQRPLVLASQRSAVRVEGDEHLGGSSLMERIAVFAHWAQDTRVSRSAAELTQALLDGGYEVILVSTAEGIGPLRWEGDRPPGITVIRRPNVGYDFGSWATALERYPRIAANSQVLMVNDSLVGPFGPIGPLLDSFDRSTADVWGMTDTTQFRRHLQSYCLGFKAGRLREAPLARFWRDIRIEASRDEVIWRNEIGLSRLLERERFVTEAAIPFWRVVKDGQNPTILGWRKLLDQQFPFVKRQLLQEPHVAPDATQVPAEIHRRFGADISDWL